jgi:tRNA C32,U32 (ribose-2'-O)-methylase TrmJ
MRDYTRKEAIFKKLETATSMPVSVACINFQIDGNIGYVARAAACFGVKTMHVIGSLPKPRLMRQLSGGTSDFLNIIQHANVRYFLAHCRANQENLVSEL